jgi:hypothetical protein
MEQHDIVELLLAVRSGFFRQPPKPQEQTLHYYPMQRLPFLSH